MKIANRRSSCVGCRALELDTCTLGYPVQGRRIGQGISTPQPIYSCPRPRTYVELNEALSNRATWAYPHSRV